MTLHTFDPVVAQTVGINAAVVYQNLYFWCEKNKANNRHYYNNMWWTYNSIKAFDALFPYLTSKQVRSALDKLQANNLIASGCFNKAGYDRTKWYSVICLNGQMDMPKKANGIAQKGEPIPVVNTDEKPDSKLNVSFQDTVSKDDLNNEFEKLWKGYRLFKKEINGKAGTKENAKCKFNILFRNMKKDKFDKNMELMKQDLNIIFDESEQLFKTKSFNSFTNKHFSSYLSGKSWLELED